MAWPLSQDYNEALQNPKTSFRDPHLQAGQVVTNALGIPQPCSGNFADVYAVECPADRTKWAVKCFTREVHGLRERYREISRHLRQARLPFTVDFQYLEEGIRVGGRWYPVLKMHWVEGLTLNAFVRDSLDRPARLEALGRVWLRMAQRLRGANIAHADLQHGNVLLVPENDGHSLAVKLIDYDGMWVPALAQTPSGEVGHPAYQHPQRLREGTYGPAVDRFPLLLVGAALQCLCVGGRSLWERYDTGDNLLFRASDLAAPAQSPLFAELRTVSDPSVRAWVEQVWLACQRPLEQSPLLLEPASEASAVTRARPSATIAPARPVEAESPPPSVRGRGRAAAPWIIGGSLAACALLGGLMFWVIHSLSRTPAIPSTPESQLAQIKSGERTMAPPSAPERPGHADRKTPPEEKPDDVPVFEPVEKAPSLPKAAPVASPTVPPTEKPVPIKPEPNPTPAKPPTIPNPPAPTKTERPRDDGKFLVPSQAVQDERTRHVHDAFRGAYERHQPADLAALSAKLLKFGQNTKEEPDLRFVYLREARDLAAQAADPAQGLSILAEMSKTFALEGDEQAMKVAVLDTAGKAVHNLADPAAVVRVSRTIAEEALELLKESEAIDDYEQAMKLATLADRSARKTGDDSLSGLASRGLRRVERLQKEYAKHVDAAVTLVARPNDPEASRVMGGFRCFHKGDWAKGLPLLARCDDAKLKDLASKDLAAPESADAQVILGDGWWQLGRQENGPARGQLQQRACYWYQHALLGASESVQIRLEKRIEQHHKEFPALRTWDHLDIAQAVVMNGFLRLPKGEKDLTTRQSFSGPIEITVVARTEKNNIRLRMGKGACVIFNWENNPSELRITRPDGTDRPESGSLGTAPIQPLQPNTWYTLRWRINAKGMLVTVDGATVYVETHANDLSEKHPVRIHASDSDVDVKSFWVRPIRKK